MKRARHRFFGTPLIRRTTSDVHVELARATVPRAAMRDHMHVDPHIIVAIDATYRSLARPSAHSSVAGEAIYNPAGTVHRDCFDDSGSRYLSIAFPSYLAPTTARPIVITDGRAIRHLQAIVGNLLNGVEGSAIDDHLLAALGYIDEDGRPIRREWLEEGRRIIEESGNRSMSVASVAGRLGIHPVHFARTYRSVFGIGPARAIRQVRAAAALSAVGREHCLAEVALATGYADQSHLTREMATHYGATPMRAARLLTTQVANVQE